MGEEWERNGPSTDPHIVHSAPYSIPCIAPTHAPKHCRGPGRIQGGRVQRRGRVRRCGRRRQWACSLRRWSCCWTCWSY
jgi:hypothetical protein